MSRVSMSLAALAAAALLVGCGDGSKLSSSESSSSTLPESSSSTLPESGSSTLLSGLAIKGPLDKALVTAYRVESNGQRGAAIGQRATTSADGAYSLDLGSYTGPVEIVVTVQSGVTTSADEATGQIIPLPVDFVLRSVASVAPPTGARTPKEVHVTPFTELARELAASKPGGLTSTNIQAAASLVFKTYGFDPVSTRPIRFDQEPPATATDAQKRYAMHNAAVSEVAKSGGACATQPNGGAKLRCAVAELRDTLQVVTAPQGQAKAQLKDQVKVDALAQAMKTVAASTRNQTGINESHKIVRDLQVLAEAAKVGKVEIAVSTAQSGDDISTKARKFLDNLRANAAALEAGAADRALTVPLRDFADAVRGDAQAVPSEVADLVELADTGRRFWNQFKAGTSPFPFECAAYEGLFPSSVETARVPATSPESASYVGCVEWSGGFIRGASDVGGQPTLRGGQFVLLLNFGGDSSLANVPYVAGKRLVTITQWAGANQEPLSSERKSDPNLSGRVGFRLGNTGRLEGFSMEGDLPPALSEDGTLRALADRYRIDLSGSVAEGQDGRTTIALDSGSLGVVPVGGGAVRTTFDLSPSGATSAEHRDDASEEAQVAASRVELVGRISNAKGQINGRLVIDQLVKRATGGAEDLTRHITFTGDMSLTGVGKLLEGRLVVAPKAENLETVVVTFDGALSLPNRPKASLEGVSVEVSDDDIRSFSGTYVQNGVTVRFSGQGSGSVGSFTFDGVDPAVSMTATTGENLIVVKVEGATAATIDQDRSRVIYVDGSFESLL